MYEGQALNFAGQHGTDMGAYSARCCIDGAMNALVRMVGPEEAAQYAFALADRIVGGVREPTEFPPKLIALPLSAAVPIEIKTADPQKPKPMRFFTIFIVGWLCGLITGSASR